MHVFGKKNSVLNFPTGWLITKDHMSKAPAYFRLFQTTLQATNLVQELKNEIEPKIHVFGRKKSVLIFPTGWQKTKDHGSKFPTNFRVFQTKLRGFNLVQELTNEIEPKMHVFEKNLF